MRSSIFDFWTQSGDLKRQPGFSMYESFEATVNTALNGAMQNAGQAASDSLNRHNNFKATVSSGSKGKYSSEESEHREWSTVVIVIVIFMTWLLFECLL